MDVYMTVCVCVCFSLAYIFIPSLYCVIKNKLRIQGEQETGRMEESESDNTLQCEFRLRNARLYLQKQPNDRAGGQFPTDIC